MRFHFRSGHDLSSGKPGFCILLNERPGKEFRWPAAPASESPRAGPDPAALRRRHPALVGARAIAAWTNSSAAPEAAVTCGTFGSPTFFIGEEIFFGKDQLRDVEEEYRRQHGRARESLA
jgi:hypothetical protein